MKPLIVANWKCHPKTLKEAKELFALIKKGIKGVKEVEVVVAPPFVFLPFLKPEGNLKLGAQDCFWEEKGAFTGEVSPGTLADLNCSYVILGHSERRKLQKETDEEINKKIKAALKEGLMPILCVDQVSQVEKGLEGVVEKIVIAYEPLFAIGTGKACDYQTAENMRLAIQKIAKGNRVLYGGSVNSQNAGDYLKKAGFDGLLVGGASLSEEFIEIVLQVV
jgi:triosephosphate isomerase